MAPAILFKGVLGAIFFGDPDVKKAKDLMRQELTTAGEDAPLKEAARLMAERELSGLPVVSGKNEVVGFVSERDIIAAAFPGAAKFTTPEVISLANLFLIVKKLGCKGESRVRDYMSADLYHVAEETPFMDIVELMLDKNLKRLPVLRNKHLVGVIERVTLSKVALEEGL